MPLLAFCRLGLLRVSHIFIEYNSRTYTVTYRLGTHGLTYTYSASNLDRPLLWSVVIENVFSCKMVSIVVKQLLLAESVYLSLLSICESLKRIS